jgi:hypothetical protein
MLGRSPNLHAGICWQRTCNYIGVRIVPNAASTDATTTPAVHANASAGSFLDILLSGVGVGVQNAEAAGARTQSQSQANPSDRSSNDDETSQTATFEAEVGASAPTESSTIAKTVMADQSELEQNGQTPNNAATNPSAQNSATQALPASLNAAQWLAKNANGLDPLLTSNAVAASATKQPAPSGKQSSAPQGSNNKLAAISAAAAKNETPALVVTIPTPLPLEQLPMVQGAASVLESLATKSAGCDQTNANPTGPQPAATDSTSSMQVATPRPIANPALVLPNVLAEGLQTATQADAQSTSAGAASVPQPASSNLASPSASSSTFLSAAIPTNNGILSPTAAKLTQYKAAGTTFTANSNGSSSTSNATAAPGVTGTTKSNTQDSSGNSSRNTQNSSDATQRALADASQAANNAAKPTDSGTTQAIAFGSLVASHETAQPHTASGTASDAPHSAAESENLPSETSNAGTAGVSSGINSARVIQSMSETEMRVGMHSSEFGDISIRTMVSQQQVQAQISVDHSELSSALSGHIPSMQAKFGNDFGLHATIEVNQGGTGFSGEREQSSQKEQRSFVQSFQADTTQTPMETDRLTLRAPPAVVDGSRLDIRA